MNVLPFKTIVGQGYSSNVNATIMNIGSYSETFNVTLYANTTLVETREVTLTIESSTTLTFVWSTTGFAYGNHTLTVFMEPVENETNTADNTLVGGSVIVTIPGDVNGDKTVDIFDAIMLSGAYGSQPSSPNWNANADINGDNTVDIFDAILLAGNYGQTII